MSRQSKQSDLVAAQCDLCRLVALADTEDLVFRVLLESALKKFGFSNARFYDANKCPFDDRYFYTLRLSTKVYPNAPIGYRIYDASLTDELVTNPTTVWETSDSPTTPFSEAKKQWIIDLDLQGKGWIDVPVVTGDHLLGLWALDRPSSQTPSSSEKAVLLRLASLAALKIHELREERIDNLTTRMFERCDTLGPTNGLLIECCTEICASLDAAFLAYFRLDSQRGCLIKEIEVFAKDDKFELISEDTDKQYVLGQCLTGSVFENPKLRYIPDFLKLQQRNPALVDMESLSSHERKQGAKLRTVLYQLIDVPGSSQGMLRAINRKSIPSLSFTGEHKLLLKRVAYPFAQILGMNEASDRLETIWNSFSKTVGKVQAEGINYQEIANSANKMGFPGMIITIWSSESCLVEVWSDDARVEASLRNHVGKLQSSIIQNMEPQSTLNTQSLPRELSVDLRDAGIYLVHAVYSSETTSRQANPEQILTLFPLHRTSGVELHSKLVLPTYWRQKYPEVLRALDILGRLVATTREIARNRSLLYLAEEAVGTIAHEIKTPASSLVDLTKVICDQEVRLFEKLPDTHDFETPVAEVAPNCTLYTRTLHGKREHVNWLAERAQKISNYATRFQRVVDDAIRWARMSGKTIEMHLQPVVLSEILRDCIYELRLDIQTKSAEAKRQLKIEVNPSVQKIPVFNADPFLLRNLFINLLDNAVKYTHNPGLAYDFKIGVVCEPQSKILDVKVSNWGLGIDKADYENIFSSFYRSSVRDRVHTVRGVGLGLSTCKRIVRLHRGQITVTSVPTLVAPDRIKAKEGYQTTFTIRLPLDLPAGRVNVDGTTFKREV